jgi:SAM-dependent methyltransferase
LNAARSFDSEHYYESYNRSRATVLSELVPELRKHLELRTAVDVGCGLGYFSALLHSLGFQVTAVDGRAENVAEAQRRVPQASFHAMNAEDFALRKLGRYDLVLCFGLLYHLENPFLAIRHLHAIASKLLLVESTVAPGAEPIMRLVDEYHGDDQGLNHVAFYPTEACLAKMMYQAGFPNVYRLAKMPEHPDFQANGSGQRVRTMLAAAHAPLQSAFFERLEEPEVPYQPWSANRECAPALSDRLRRFAGKPWSAKVESLKRILGGH